MSPRALESHRYSVPPWPVAAWREVFDALFVLVRRLALVYMVRRILPHNGLPIAYVDSNLAEEGDSCRKILMQVSRLD